jgi:hypothetical protein
MRSRYTNLGNLLKKNEVVDTYIEGDFKWSDLKELQVCVAECCVHGAWKRSDGDRRLGVSPAAIGERVCFGGDRGRWRPGALRRGAGAGGRRSWRLASWSAAAAIVEAGELERFGGDRGGWRAGALRRRSWLLVSGATAVASGSAEAASTSDSDRGCCCAGSLLWCAGVLASGR